MILSATETLPVVEAEMNYLAPMSERPRNYVIDPPPGVPRNSGLPDPHFLPIHDARPLLAEIDLERHGFAFLSGRSAVSGFDDEEEIRTVYYPEAEELVRKATGADRVFIFDHTLRRHIPDSEDRGDGPRQPVRRVHVDHTDRSGPQRVRDFFPDEADELLKGRVQIINLWRPIRHAVHDMPLAVCDARTVAPADLVPSDLVYAHRVGETYSVTFNPAHRWFYLSNMRPDEAVLLRCYDSAAGPARFAPHSAFLAPHPSAEGQPRESIEIRTLVFHRS